VVANARHQLRFQQTLQSAALEGMMRSLVAIAALVVYPCTWAEVSLTNINNNEVADADEVMGNFNALRQGVESNIASIEALPTPPTDCAIDQIIRWDGSAWVCADETGSDDASVRGWYYTASFAVSTSVHEMFEVRSLNARNFSNDG
jgi:hypothetical protein